MKDWRAIAVASGRRLEDDDARRIVPVLESLEAAFRPLAACLRPEMESAIIFRADPGQESE